MQKAIDKVSGAAEGKTIAAKEKRNFLSSPP
jgi:hypothetical protein